MVTEIQNLIRQKQEINNLIIEQIKRDISELKRLADDMAEAATSMQGQGYGRFINCRETFFSTVDEMSFQYIAQYNKSSLNTFT